MALTQLYLHLRFSYLVFGPVWAKVGPKTPLNESGSENGAERPQKWPQGPILAPFRGSFMITSAKTKMQNGCLTASKMKYKPQILGWPYGSLEVAPQCRGQSPIVTSTWAVTRHSPTDFGSKNSVGHRGAVSIYPMLHNACGPEINLPGSIRPDPHRESLIIGPPAGRMAAFDVFPPRIRPKSGSSPEALLRHIRYM